MSPHKGVMLLLLVIFGFLGCSNAEMFSLDVPGGSIQANLGSSVLLPCELSPALNVESFEVRWHRPNKYDNPVLLYKDLKIQESSVDPQYRGRVNLVGDLQKGDVSLKLENLTLADSGEYVCYVKSHQWYDKANVLLNITVVGSLPVLSFFEAGDQVNVTCESDGWSPKPSLTWRNKRGRELKNSVVQPKTDSEGLVSVRSWLMFSPSDSEWISCVVGLSDLEIKEGRVLPVKPAPATEQTPGVSPGWKVSIILLVFILLLFTITALLLFPVTREYIFSKVRKITTAGHLDEEANLLVPVGETTIIESTENYQKGSAVKETPEAPAKSIEATVQEKCDKETNTEKETPDWEKMTGCKVAIRPDASTTSFLKIGEKKSTVTCKSDVRNKTIFNHVLCEERIYSGRYYWEITALTEPYTTSNIIKKYECPSSWYVGVTIESSEKKNRVPLTPQNGYWVLQYEKERGYYAYDPFCKGLAPVLARDRFSRLGVFIDCERHTLSFYDCDKKSHLYTFYNVDSTQPLIPVLSPGDKEHHTLAICQEKCVNFGELYTQPDGKVSSANTAAVDSPTNQLQNTSISPGEGGEGGPSTSTKSKGSKGSKNTQKTCD